MNRTKQLVASFGVMAAIASAPSRASAAPIGLLEYVETSLGGGLFRYDYSLLNGSDPIADAGADIYDLALFWSPSVSLITSVLPADWDAISGVGFVNAFSLIPGASPFGSDIGPGQMLAFSFTFDGRIGDIPFEVLLTNLSDPSNPFQSSGMSEAGGGSPPAPVPEPASILLVGSGAVLALVRRLRRVAV